MCKVSDILLSNIPSTITMKVVISVILEIRKADIDVAFLASAALTITFIIGIKGSSIRGICGGRVLRMNSTDSMLQNRWYRR
jgi:hypothetical protein